LALWIVIAVTAVRVLILILTPLELYPDEAQYWWWAQTPAFGYFSKPPTIAWVIWLTTAVFGQSEWAIRFAAPLLHGATALLVFGIGRLTFNARVGFWSALAYLTAPGISYSSALISTDVPLLFFWAAALYAFLRAMPESERAPGWRWTVICGVAVGLGFETKYAMAYFILGAGLAAIVSPGARKLVLSLRGLTILAIAAALLLPNVLWNAAHGFPTVAHTGHNADWSHARYNPMNILSFLGGQFGVFGPVLMAGLLLAFWRLARSMPRADNALILAAFSAPVLLLITVQSFIAEANANWAAVAYVAGAPLAVAALLELWQGRALWASFIFDGVVMAVLWIILAAPPFADRIGQGNAFKRMEGWSVLGRTVALQAGRAPYDAIAAANRSTMAELLYYARPRTTPMRMWDSDLHDDDHFQMTMRLTHPMRRVLLVIAPDEAHQVLPTFDSATALLTIVVPIGGHHTRTTTLYDARDYRGPQPRS
jgi:4-amino-4-deoxy-L-arabinose transferase-like glycosyltransferase